MLQQQTEIVIKLVSSDKPVIIKGNEINVGDLIVKKFTEIITEINLPQILSVKPKNIEKYLNVKIDSRVTKNQVIVLKKSLLKKIQIKAPHDGILCWLKKEEGIVGIKNQIESESSIKSWFKGIVKSVESDRIIFLCEGEFISGKSGYGKRVTGILKIIDMLNSIYDLPIDLKSKIIALKFASADMIAKADALGAVAVIAENLEQPPFSLPHLIIDKLDQIKRYDNFEITVFGDEKQILVNEPVKKTQK